MVRNHKLDINNLIACKIAGRSRDVKTWISIVGNLRAEPMFPIGSIADNLQSSIRKLNSVLPADDVTVAYRVVGIIVSKGVFLHRIVEVKWHAWLVVMMMVVLKLNYKNCNENSSTKNKIKCTHESNFMKF